MRMALLLAATVFVATAAAQQPAESRRGGPAPFAEKYLQQGLAQEAAGQIELARGTLSLVLERAARHIPGLVALARVEQKLGLLDPATFHARSAIDACEALLAPSPEEKQLRREAEAIVQTADPAAKAAADPLGKLPALLLEDARAYRKRGLHMLALRVLEQLKTVRGSTPEIDAMIADIRRTGGDEVAVEDALGGEDPLKGVSAAWIERSDAEHRAWEQSYTKDTEHYTVRTNAGYEILETVALIVEPLHRFYRTFYGIDPKKPVPKVEVKIYATHDEFVAVAPPDMKTSGGYFAGKEIVSYDPRPGGGAMGTLIETLAHEASHQFTSLISRGWQPPWMNEGTASFFEGTTLLSNRNVRMNLVPRHSYRLETFIEHRRSNERFSLPKLLNTGAGLANYTGTHYAYGWALIYFLWNDEDEKGGHPFRAPLVSMMTRGWNQPPAPEKHLQDFTEQIIALAKVPGITDLGSFETAWQAWIDDLDKIHSGRLDPAPRDLEKARAIAATKEKKAALPIYERVLARRPADPDVLFESAVLALDAGQRSLAADRFGRFIEHVEGSVDQKDKRLQQALNEMSKLDPEFGRRRKAEAAAVERFVALATQYEKERFGMCALRCLERAQALGLRQKELADQTVQVRRTTGATLRTWRLLFNEQDIREWTYADAEDNTWRVEGETLVSEYAPSTTGTGEKSIIDYRMLHARQPARASYTFSATMSADSEGCRLLGVCFGIHGSERFDAILVLPKSATVDLSTHDGGWAVLDRKPWNAQQLAGWFTIVIKVDGDSLEATLNGAPLFKRTIPGIGAGGNFGLLMGGGKARFRHLRVFEPD